MKTGQIHIKYAILYLAVLGLALGTAVAKTANQPIYNKDANARQNIADAIARASKTGRNIVLIFGANW